jgi:hypothetical protein
MAPNARLDEEFVFLCACPTNRLNPRILGHHAKTAGIHVELTVAGSILTTLTPGVRWVLI